MTGCGRRVDLTRVRRQIAAEAAAVAAVAEVVDDDAFAELLQTLHRVSGKVVTTAVGNSGAIAERLAHLLSLCGLPAFFLDANQALHGSIGAIESTDLLVAMSKGGVTDEVNTCVERVRRTDATVIVVTEAPDSPLARIADQVQVLPPSHADYAGMVGMGSALAQAAWSDAVVAGMAQLRNATPEQLEERHPRGLIGHQAAQSGPWTDQAG